MSCSRCPRSRPITTRCSERVREPEARQQLAGIGREVATILVRDFLPGEPRKQIQSAMSDVEIALNARFAPDEPMPSQRKLRERNRKEYQGRTWATREHLEQIKQ